MAATESFKYGAIAAVVAVVLIAAAVATAPTVFPTGSGSPSQQQTSSPGNLAVLLTDPPNVPSGTTQLNLTYSAITLLVAFPNGSSKWVPVKASGTVNLLTLVNVTQTLGTVSIPINSTVSKIEFTIASVKAVVDGQVVSVTTLSSQLLVSIANAGKAGSNSGVLLDLRPTLVQIRATNTTGGSISYYVLVPSATAIIKSGVGEGQFKEGARTNLGNEDMGELDQALRATSQNLTITSASVSSSGNQTRFTVALKNQGDANTTIFGLTLAGQFNSTVGCPPVVVSTSTGTDEDSGHNSSATHTEAHDGPRQESCFSVTRDHPLTIPFKVNGDTLIPLVGSGDDEGIGKLAPSTLVPGQSITLSFTGVLQVGFGHEGFMPAITLTPVAGDTYAVRLMGEGFQTIQVNAT